MTKTLNEAHRQIFCPFKATAAMMLDHDLKDECDMRGAQLWSNEKIADSVNSIRECDGDRCRMWSVNAEDCALKMPFDR